MANMTIVVDFPPKTERGNSENHFEGAAKNRMPFGQPLVELYSVAQISEYKGLLGGVFCSEIKGKRRGKTTKHTPINPLPF